MPFVGNPSSPAPANRLTVLLSNEQDSWHATVRQLLAPQGITTISARTGREALSLLESHAVHVAVLDHHMPQLSGLQVIKLVREHASKHATARAGATARTGAFDRTGVSDQTTGGPATILLAESLTTPLLQDALSMSVFTVLSKPVNHDQLLDALARALRRFHNSQWPAPPVHNS